MEFDKLLVFLEDNPLVTRYIMIFVITYVISTVINIAFFILTTLFNDRSTRLTSKLFKLTSDYTDKLSRLVADYTASRREYDLKIKASLDSVNRRISFLDSEINNYFKQLGLSGIEVNKKPNYRSTENKRWNKRKRVTYESKK